MGNGTIYRAWSPSSKSYIGQTVQSLQTRKNNHKNAALTLRKKYPFYNAIRHYGWERIQWEKLHKNVPTEQLNNLEKQAIQDFDSFHNGYNCTTGGNSQYEREHSARARQKMKENHWARDPQAKQKVIDRIKQSRQGQPGHSAWSKGMKLGPRPEETKRKISLGNKGLPGLKGSEHPFFGKQHTEETKLKISQTLRDRKLSYRKLSRVQKEEIKKLYRTKKYRQIDLAGLYSVTRSTISNIICGYR